MHRVGGMATLQNKQETQNLRPLSVPCAKCQPIIDGLSESPKKAQFSHYENLAELESSAESGCLICAQISHGIGKTTLFDGDGDSKNSVGVAYQVWDRHFYTWYFASKKPDWELKWDERNRSPKNDNLDEGHTEGIICIEKTRTKESSVVFVQAANRALNYDSPDDRANTIDALPIARRWYQECRTLHETCKRNPKSAIPTRLIDISGNEPRLRLADELGFKVEYATLSHCWGSLKFTVLTTSTFESFRKRIPPEALPKTFKNAIFIAQYFGFRFLWIDSLCILQDSVEDWNKESTLMTEVYGECDLNIAATSAKDGSEGCFFPRERSWRCQVSPNSQTEQIYDCYTYSTLEPYVDRLSKRAWVLQERCLSQRTVHFANNQLYWECCGIVASEIYPNGYPLSIAGNTWKFLYQKHQLSRSSWPKLVQMYSEGLTTISSDRLVAIGGLARVIYSKSQDEYIAGFWKKGLEGQLWWRSYQPSRRIDPYLAPTWSWASHQGGVDFGDWYQSENNLPRMCTFRVHDIQMQYVSDNPFGQVRTGILRLRCNYLVSGVIQQGSLFASKRNYDFHIGCHVAHDFDISFDCIEEGGRGGAGGAGGEDEEETWFIHVHMLPMLTDNIVGLLLRPIGQKRGRYERIGTYSTSNGHLSMPDIDDANLVALELDHHFAEVSSDSTGNKEYFIDLV